MNIQKITFIGIASLATFGLAGLAFVTSSQSMEKSLLLQEAERQLETKQTSTYQHITDVDEASGRYNYDCSGFLDYSLQRVLPEAYGELPVSKSKVHRPLAQDFYALFASKAQETKHWERIRKASDLRAGDIVAWLRPQDLDSHNTGHVMIVRAKPSPNPDRPNEILIPVIDSTSAPHAKDSRRKGQTGLGTGTIGVVQNAEGEAIAYYWRGGLSKREEITPIAFGRLH
ncbi:hypothetical protein [Pseudanabaena sp. UWO310]|uniref:hypothetical protein n=1 Tax=Pseudanabaena sp. UWO310 TaxID=2480795 RepID=UPI001158709F|nr:hypothetical protein [Pseudanabaena sp. UWO310]TYQ30544.1 hypothetical protein PseudUWO310_07860 [Pseudanabaena sp. UWO310]